MIFSVRHSELAAGRHREEFLFDPRLKKPLVAAEIAGAELKGWKQL
jgi:hypothetical protein